MIAYVTDILSVLLERAREFLLQVALLLLQHLLLLKTRGKLTLVGKDINYNTKYFNVTSFFRQYCAQNQKCAS